MNPSDDPLVAIVVLNWNGCARTLECVKALDDVDYQPQHLIVVDNGSTDGSVDVRQLKLSTAFAALAALHEAKAERWGQFDLMVSTRGRVMVDLLSLIARGAVRVTTAKLSQRRHAV